MTFDDGASIVCSEDHYWKCKLKKSERFGKGRKNKWGVYSLQEIRKHGGDDPIPRERAVIPCAVCEMDPQEVPLDPYTLGVILGDGGISQDSVNFTTEDEEIAEMVQSSVGTFAKVTKRAQDPDTKARCYGVISPTPTCTNRPSPVKEALKQLGLMGLLSHQKFIPECYLENGVEVRLQLLRGLMDTDGYADKGGNTYFYSSSSRLAEGICRLVRSLGGKACVRWKETDIATVRTKRRGRPLSRRHKVPRRKCLNMAIVWIDIPHFSPFGLERKTSRWESRKRWPIHGRFLEKIEPFGNAECCCIRVDSPDHTFVTQDYIV
ncbi:MAG TPA: LAGLIDADG family homing endonuclease, partial [Phycisphaerae bacterium]|nr:LAGLIDADG family homing endonuclease [Phycisphaerae bacterium]